MPANETRDPAEIEREIRATQRDMSRTVDQIGEQFTPRNLMNALLDKADEKGVDADYLLDQARRNPIALGMIAIGGIWLVSDSDARLSTFSDMMPGHNGNDGRREPEFDRWDMHHRGYVEHMARCEPRPDEDQLAYRRRRDQARASYLMIEQRHDEDEKSFRDRLDEATDRLREQRDRLSERAAETGRSIRQQGGRVAHKVESAFYQNPLIGGLVAAAVGAVAGSALPMTRTEEEKLGPMGSDALDSARQKAHEAGDRLREKKDELVDKADEKMRDAGREPDRQVTGGGTARVS